MTNENPDKTFESAISRLEQILEKMHVGNVPLEESLKLYDEAEKLIQFCGKKLNDAEQKIETLVKNRSGETALGLDGKPVLQPFQPNGKN